MTTGAPHVDRQRCHQNGGDNPEDPFPQRLIPRAWPAAGRRQCSGAPTQRCPSARPESARAARSCCRYARLIATMRKASSPSRRVITNAWSMCLPRSPARTGVCEKSVVSQYPTSQVGIRKLHLKGLVPSHGPTTRLSITIRHASIPVTAPWRPHLRLLDRLPRRPRHRRRATRCWRGPARCTNRVP